MSIRRIMLFVLLTMSLLAFLIGGYARKPVSGRPEVTLISAEEEREIGAAEARKVQHILGIVEDPEKLRSLREGRDVHRPIFGQSCLCNPLDVLPFVGEKLTCRWVSAMMLANMPGWRNW